MSHFNVSLTVRSINHNFRTERTAEADRTEVSLLTSLEPYRWATPAHTCSRQTLGIQRPVNREGHLRSEVYLSVSSGDFFFFGPLHLYELEFLKKSNLNVLM